MEVLIKFLKVENDLLFKFFYKKSFFVIYFFLNFLKIKEYKKYFL